MKMGWASYMDHTFPNIQSLMSPPGHYWSWRQGCGWHADARCHWSTARRTSQILFQSLWAPPTWKRGVNNWSCLWTISEDENVLASWLIHILQLLPPDEWENSAPMASDKLLPPPSCVEVQQLSPCKVFKQFSPSVSFNHMSTFQWCNVSFWPPCQVSPCPP